MNSPHPELSVSELIVLLAIVRLARTAQRIWVEHDGKRWRVIE